MIKKSEKLVCAYITLISRKYSDSFVSANLFFTDQELVNEAITNVQIQIDEIRKETATDF